MQKMKATMIVRLHPEQDHKTK